jgi:hypothetical protein
MIARRSLLVGLGSLIAAPAIVRVSSLMPVRAIEPQLWAIDSGEWFSYTEELSEVVRQQVLPLTKWCYSRFGPYIVAANDEAGIYVSPPIGGFVLDEQIPIAETRRAPRHARAAG